MITIPRPFLVISTSASDNVALGLIRGISSPVFIMLVTKVNNLLPSEPEGCDLAKSSGVKPFIVRSDTAMASPIARVAVVDAVGAKL